jgi:asparagine synthase (glutamine-hydrolysing)
MMSGIFGVLDSKSSQIEPLLTKMGAEMAHREWYVVETYADKNLGIGLGRIGIGIFNREQQPIFSEDRNLMVFLSGELYNTERLRRDLKAKGHRFRDDNDLELVLRLYQEKEEQFIHDLEGAFVLVIWNRPRQQLIIANDRFGLYPLYYAHYDGKLIFAPKAKGILCDPHFRKELDLTALAEYMRFQQLLGEKTFFEGISVLPHASLVHYAVQGNRLTVDSYWDFSDIPAQPVTVSFEDAVEETGRLLRQAVNRLASRPYRIGVYLSGGLDSRTILGLIDREHFPVTSITYGQNKCRDVVYGEKIARSVGSDHHWFEFKNGEWVKEHADFHLELTEGFHSWIHAHGISTLTKARSLLDVNLTGWGLDTLAGGYLGDSLLIQAPDDLTFVERLFHLLNQEYTWPGINEAESRYVYAEELGRHVVGRAFESLLHEVQKLPCDDNEQRAKWFMTDTHDRRLTHNFLVFKRSHFESRYPSRDYAFFEFCWSLPMEFKYNRQLQRSVISRKLPKLARIPYDKDELLLTDSWPSWTAHALVYKLKRRFNRHIFPLFPERATLYADYENYLRNELRPWAEGILLDNRTLERGIFNPQFLRSIWDRHLSGLELHTIGKIAPIMTYEMMLRRFFDESP